jgi:DNA-binding NarL/FixJ family response regulator
MEARPDGRLVELGLKGKSQMNPGYGTKPWTPEEEEQLRSLIMTGLRPHEIAVKLRRSVSAVRTRAYYLRFSFKRLSRRTEAAK